MRETYSTLLTLAHEATETDSTDSDVADYLKRALNRSYRDIQAELDNFTTQITRTTSTVDGQQYYHLPPDCVTLENVTITISSVDYVLRPVHSQNFWDEINALTFSGSAFRRYFFQRRDDFGIWPEPQDAYTMYLTFQPRHKDLGTADYTTGTVTVTNDDATVTGSGTTFTQAMVGRWFATDDDGMWYRIASYTDGTNIELENVFQGTTAAGASYTIGESPEIPPELHEILPWGAARLWFIEKRKNSKQAAFWSNMFYTGDPQNSSRQLRDCVGGLLGAKKRYAARASTGIIEKRGKSKRDFWVDKAWATTLSS